MSEYQKNLRIGQILVLYWLSYVLAVVTIYYFVQNSPVFVAAVFSAIFDPPKDRPKLPENYTSNTWAETTITPFYRSPITADNASAARTTLGPHLQKSDYV